MSRHMLHQYTAQMPPTHASHLVLDPDVVSLPSYTTRDPQRSSTRAGSSRKALNLWFLTQRKDREAEVKL